MHSYLRFVAFKISVSSNETDSLEEQFVIIKGRESSSTGRRGKLRESTKGKKKGAALISHLDVISWTDHRLTDNCTIITSRSLSLVLMRIFALPLHLTISLPFPFRAIGSFGRSIYISVFLPLFADKRVSMATLSSGRGTNRISARSTYLSPGLFLSLSISLFFLPHGCPFLLVRSLFLSRSLVDWSAGRLQL